MALAPCWGGTVAAFVLNLVAQELSGGNIPLFVYVVVVMILGLV